VSEWPEVLRRFHALRLRQPVASVLQSTRRQVSIFQPSKLGVAVAVPSSNGAPRFQDGEPSNLT